MNAIETWLLEYLVNSLWQAPLLLGAGLVAARVLRACGPAVEHRVWVTVLLLQATLPACRFDPLPWLRLVMSGLSGQPAHQAGLVTLQIGPGLALGAGALPPWLVTSLTLGFALATLFFAARLVWGLRQTNTLRQSATPAVLPAEAGEFAAFCRLHFNAREAVILSSPLAPGPLTLGIRRPAVLLPEGMLDRVTGIERNAALAHEFAHIRRHDYAKNLCYQALALPLLYHPALWVTRSRLTESREVLCDHLAAGLLPSPQVYARSLVRLAELLLPGHPAPVPHAIGILDAHSFERRVMQLTRIQPTAKGLRAAARFGVAPYLRSRSLCFGARSACNRPSGRRSDTLDERRTPGGCRQNRCRRHGRPDRLEDGGLSIRPTRRLPISPGAVVLHAIIGKDGRVQNLTVLSGPQELQNSALDAVSQWVYKPYLLNGEPTEVETTITVNYSFGTN